MRVASVLLALGCQLSIAGAQWSEVAARAVLTPSAARTALEQMSPAERKNSSVSVEFANSDSGAAMLGREVEWLWNGGEHDEAIAQLTDLEARVGHVAIGISWREPVSTLETTLWESDVRIGNRDSLAEVAIDMDTEDGNLFVVLRHSGGVPHYSFCASFDGGATWVETFAWVGSPPMSVDVGVVSDLGGHAYVAYNSPDENAQQVRLRRFLCSDGSGAAFPTGAMWIAPCTLAVGDTMKEVSLIGRPYGYSGTPVFLTLVSDGRVLYSQPQVYDVMPWFTITVVDSGASHGLDATGNQDRSTTPFFSYCGTDDTVRIYSQRSGVFTRRFSHFAGPGALTSISARSDRIICAFEDRTSSPHQVRCAVNPDNGDTWTIGTLGDSSVPAAAPAVMSRGRPGFGAVFQRCAPALELRFCQRTDSGPWSDPVSIADHEPYRCRPGIEDLGDGVFGVAYLSDSGPVVRGAFLDRSDWPYGLAEKQRPQASSRASLATVVRRMLFLPGDGLGTRSGLPDNPVMSRAALLDISGRKVMDLEPGANDVRTLAPGVYFVKGPETRDRGPAGIRKVVVTR